MCYTISSMRQGDTHIEHGARTDVAMATMVAHELKSPLALIRHLSQEIQHDLTHSPDQISLIHEQITLTSERLLRLVQNITTAETLNQELFQLEPINPLAVCEDVLHEIQPLYRAQGRDIIVKKRRKIPLILANRDLLHRVVSHFADNALKYTPKGSTVYIGLQQQANKRVRIAVRDFGPGVDAHVVRSVQEGRCIKFIPRRPDSNGLGLYIAGQFADCMDARLGVSTHRDGASFYIDSMESNQLSLI